MKSHIGIRYLGNDNICALVTFYLAKNKSDYTYMYMLVMECYISNSAKAVAAIVVITAKIFKKKEK